MQSTVVEASSVIRTTVSPPRTFVNRASKSVDRGRDSHVFEPSSEGRETAGNARRPMGERTDGQISRDPPKT
jgi:hypothetical protein